MPKITEFDAPPSLQLRPSDMASEAWAGAARRIGAFYNQAAEAKRSFGVSVGGVVKDIGQHVDDVQTNSQISAGAADAVTALSSLSSDWDTTLKGGTDAQGNQVQPANPNDPAVAQRWRQDKFEDWADKFRDRFTTARSQQWAEARVETMRQHFFTKTTADQSELAGVARKQDAIKVVNGYSNAVRDDPASVDMALQSVDADIGAIVHTSPVLEGATAVRLHSELGFSAKQQIVRAYYSGLAEKNPDEAEAQIKAGKYAEYISNGEFRQIVNEARGYKRMNEFADRSAREEQQRQAKSDFHGAMNEIELSTLPKNPGDPPTLPADYWNKVKRAGQMPGAELDPSRLNSMILNGERLTERLNKPEPMGRVSHDTAMDLLSRIRASGDDPNRLSTNDEIYKAYGDGKLNNADFSFLQREYANIRTPEGEALVRRKADFIKSVEPLIDKSNPLMGKIDQSGKQQLYEFNLAIEDKIAEYRKAGKNAYDLFNPAKPDYLGKPEALQPYQKPLQQSLADRVRTLSGGAPPAPGATARPSAKETRPLPPAFAKDPDGSTYVKDGKTWTKRGSQLEAQ